MATTTYDDALRIVQQLTFEERRRLQHDLAALDTHGSGQPAAAAAKRAKTLAVLDNLDRLAAEIATEWTDELSALDAIHDVRRDL